MRCRVPQDDLPRGLPIPIGHHTLWGLASFFQFEGETLSRYCAKITIGVVTLTLYFLFFGENKPQMLQTTLLSCVRVLKLPRASFTFLPPRLLPDAGSLVVYSLTIRLQHPGSNAGTGRRSRPLFRWLSYRLNSPSPSSSSPASSKSILSTYGRFSAPSEAFGVSMCYVKQGKTDTGVGASSKNHLESTLVVWVRCPSKRRLVIRAFLRQCSRDMPACPYVPPIARMAKKKTEIGWSHCKPTLGRQSRVQLARSGKFYKTQEIQSRFLKNK